MAYRVRLGFEPSFEGPIQKWTKKYVAKNLWKYADQYTFDDMMQEAAFKFSVCVRAYPRVVEPKHFMALYQRAVGNHFIKLAKKASRNRSLFDPNRSLSHTTTIPEDKRPELAIHGEAEILCLWHSAPGELKRLINVLHSPIIKVHTIRRNSNGTRETTNEYWCRLLGLDPIRVDLYSMARMHFFPETVNERRTKVHQ